MTPRRHDRGERASLDEVEDQGEGPSLGKQDGVVAADEAVDPEPLQNGELAHCLVGILAVRGQGHDLERHQPAVGDPLRPPHLGVGPEPEALAEAVPGHQQRLHRRSFSSGVWPPSLASRRRPPRALSTGASAAYSSAIPTGSAQNGKCDPDHP